MRPCTRSRPSNIAPYGAQAVCAHVRAAVRPARQHGPGPRSAAPAAHPLAARSGVWRSGLPAQQLASTSQAPRVQASYDASSPDRAYSGAQASSSGVSAPQSRPVTRSHAPGSAHQQCARSEQQDSPHIRPPTTQCPNGCSITNGPQVHVAGMATRRRQWQVPGRQTHVPVPLAGEPSRRARVVRCHAAAGAAGAGGGEGASDKPLRSTSPSLWSSQTPPAKLAVMIVFALLLGVANRVLYRVALVPMANYVFFLAQFQNIGYLLVYFTALAFRYRAGRVTDAMLRIDKRPLWAIGACEAAAQLLFMCSAAHLPGPLLPLINQSYLCWNLLFAFLILGTRFSKSQLGGAGLITLGVVLAALPPSDTLSTAAAAHQPVDPLYVLLAVLCFAFPALASIIKDRIFRDEKQRLGQPLDIFMVNSFGSLFQTVFCVLLLPINLALVGVALPELPTYLSEGARCFTGLTPSCGSDCTLAPLLVTGYVTANLAFNIAMLVLLRSCGSVGTTLVGSCLVPLTILAFITLPLPLPPSVMGPGFPAGSVILLAGLLVFNWNVVVKPILQAIDNTDSVDLPAP